MSFDSIEWVIPDFRVPGETQSGGLDVHVIFSGKPTTLELGDRLAINFTEGGVKKRLAARLFSPPDPRVPELNSLVFNSIFPFTLARHGAEVGVKGQLRVAATRPAGTPLRNFIVEAIAFFGDGR